MQFLPVESRVSKSCRHAEACLNRKSDNLSTFSVSNIVVIMTTTKNLTKIHLKQLGRFKLSHELKSLYAFKVIYGHIVAGAVPQTALFIC